MVGFLDLIPVKSPISNTHGPIFQQIRIRKIVLPQRIPYGLYPACSNTLHRNNLNFHTPHFPTLIVDFLGNGYGISVGKLGV